MALARRQIGPACDAPVTGRRGPEAGSDVTAALLWHASAAADRRLRRASAALARRDTVQKRIDVRRVLCVLVALGLSGCSTSKLTGRYYSEDVRGEWLEFRGDRTVMHSFSGDTASYRVDGDTVVIVIPSGAVKGQIAGPSVIRFPEGAAPFAGVWVAAEPSGPALDGEAARAASKELLGRWRIPGATDVFELRPDGTYNWGPDISGTYQVVEGAQIRRSMVQRGQLINAALEEHFVIEGDVLRLTMRDGSITTYERAN
jgi:hypothetical protein